MMHQMYKNKIFQCTKKIMHKIGTAGPKKEVQNFVLCMLDKIFSSDRECITS